MCLVEMDGQDDEEFLSLSLSCITDSDSSQKKHKRKKREEIFEWDLNESYEGKFFNLLEIREEMFKIKEKKNEKAEVEKGSHLILSLILSATYIDQKDTNSAVDTLSDLYQNISLFDDSLQRVAAYFADGLVAKLLTRKSSLYDVITKNPTPEEEFLAFTKFYEVSPFYQFAHFTANQIIIDAFEKEEASNNRSLHVYDFDISYGFQWPSLIQSLAESATFDDHVYLKISGFGRSLKELKETESRLVNFAKGFRNIAFEFQGLLRGSHMENMIRSKKNETVVVNLVLHLNTLDSCSKMSETMKYIDLITPSTIVVVEQDGNRSPQNILARFMESLHYFAAMFDSLDDCLPAGSKERWRIEKNHLGKEIKYMMNSEKENFNISRKEKLETWKGRMERHGFMATKLSSKCLIQARLLLMIRSKSSGIPNDGGFSIFERDEGRAVSLGWKDRCLITASAWHCTE